MIGPSIDETEHFIIQAHGQQTRRGLEVPYYTHPQAVAKFAVELLAKYAPLVEEEDAEIIVKLSLLHDVVEDTPVSIEMLGKMGYPIKLLNSLHLLTKFDDEFGKETHNEAITRIIDSGDIYAIIVKIADTHHNSLLQGSDITWLIEQGKDPACHSRRYLESNARLMESETFIKFCEVHRG